MASAEPILLGGGIAKGAPFTVGSIQLAQSATPGSIADSIIVQRTAGATTVITVGLDSMPAAVEKLKIIGGLLSDMTFVSNVPGSNFLAGLGARIEPTINAIDNVVIGHFARCDASLTGGGGNANGNVVIGGNTLDTFGGMRVGTGGNVIIGSNITLGTTGPQSGVIAIGFTANLNNFATGPIVGTAAQGRGQGVAFGNASGATGIFNYWVCVGNSANIGADGAMALGDSCDSTHAYSIVMGRNALSTQANQLVIGSLNGPISQTLIGAGATQAGGQAVTHRHTNGVGANNPAANIIFQAGLGTGNATTLGRLQFATGIPHASDSIIQTAQVVFEVLPSTGAAGSPVVSFPVFANGAAAAAGTLGNAPVAGDPTDWIPILSKGVVRYIPAW